jgi:hypothetical protein
LSRYYKVIDGNQAVVRAAFHVHQPNDSLGAELRRPWAAVLATLQERRKTEREVEP